MNLVSSGTKEAPALKAVLAVRYSSRLKHAVPLRRYGFGFVGSNSIALFASETASVPRNNNNNNKHMILSAYVEKG